MTEIVIVEDENIVRLGLSTIVNWEAEGFHIAGTFKNGKEALHFLEKTPVDIVVTDVKMPVMDGEELVHRIRDAEMPVDILILSNFDDFSIVKNCFKAGIFDYILKQDIEPEMFLKLLKDIRASRSSEQVKTDQWEKEQQEVLFWADLKAVRFDGRVEEFCRKYGSKREQYGKKKYLIIRYILRDQLTGQRYEGLPTQNQAICNGIVDISRQFFADGRILDSDGESYIVIEAPEDDEESATSKLTDWMRKAGLMVQEYFSATLRMGAAAAFRSVTELWRSREEADLAYEYLFYESDSEWIICQPTHTPFFDTIGIPDIIKEIRLCLEFNNFNTLRTSLAKCYRDMKAQRQVPPERIFEFSERILNEFDLFLQENTATGISAIDTSWKELRRKAFTIVDISEMLDAVINGVQEYLRVHEDHYEVIAKAKHIVAHSYQDTELSQSKVAGMLNISSAYFSTLFKRKTGVNFVQYLSEYRIRKAIELMAQTNDSIEKIAFQAGYQNANYFVKVFKRVTGKTVSEFRNH